MKKLALLISIVVIATGICRAQTTGFSYQGKLADGGLPASGSYDLQFKLFNQSAGGAQQGSTLSSTSVAVANGVFTATGRNAFGQGRRNVSSTNSIEIAPGLGPISPSVIASGGGTSAGDNFNLDGTLGEVSASETQSGGGFTLDGGFWNVPQDFSATPTPSPSPSPTPGSTATLGNYTNTTVQLSANATVTPDVAPTNTTHINVSTSINFHGQLAGDPTTGVVRVTDAHPAGSYTVTVTAFDSGGLTTTKTFTLTVTTLAACNPVTFAAATNFHTGDGPGSAAVGDFNGDGKQDLATANSVENSVWVFLGNGAGSFSAAVNMVAGPAPKSVAVGDFNGDGKQDLATANGSGTVSVLLGDGTGGFSAATNFTVGNGSASVAVGDFNADGKPDLAVVNDGSNNVSVLLGNGAGGFSAATNFGVGATPESVVLGDFNGDGKPDLAVTNSNNNNVSVLLGDGAGGFAAATNFAVGQAPFSVAVGDFNGDGKQDLAVANDTSNNVSVLLGDGAGSFSTASNFRVGASPESVAVGDFNGDGKQDLAVSNLSSDNVSVLLGDGAGSFSAATNFAVGSLPRSVAVGDFNGDGKQDLATDNLGSNNVSVLLQQCASATPTPTPSPTPSPTPTPTCVSVSVPTGLTTLPNTTLIAPVNAGDTTGKGIISFDFTLAYDPSVLVSAATPYDTSNTLSSGFTITVNSNTPGQLVVSGFGTSPLSGSGTLLNLKFNVAGSAPACSNLSLSSFHFNEGTPCAALANGQACVISGTISGVVSYGIVTGPVKTVPGVTLSASGSPNVNATTDANGAYSLNGFGNGPYSVTPAKTTDVNGITAFDAALVAQYVVGLITLTPNQQTAAEVSNNGAVTSFDAALIAQAAVGLPNPGSAGTWRFGPSSRTYPSTVADQPNQNYDAILMGEVSGNWTPPGGQLVTFQNQTPSTPPVSVTIPNSTAPRGVVITIPLLVGDLTPHGVISYQFDVTVNESVLRPQVAAASSAGTLSSNMTIVANSSTPGHLKVAAFGAAPLAGSGTLVNLNFNVVGAPGATTPLVTEGFLFDEGTPPASTINGQFSVSSPTAASASISGHVTRGDGAPLAGALVYLSGALSRKTITDSSGTYRFDNVELGGFYTITPALANYSFGPSSRSFSQLGNQTEAVFTGTSGAEMANPLDTPEYFVRQQYVDILGREPDESGFNYWSDQILACGADAACGNARRRDVAAAFFIEQEFQQSGSFIFDLYKGALDRRPTFIEYAADRLSIIGGINLETEKVAFARAFVERAELRQKYALQTTAESFVDALVQQVQQSSGVDLSSQRNVLIARYNSGGNQAESRSFVLRDLADSSDFKQAEYNAAFVLTEYFGYLRRDPDPSGYDFWLNLLNNREPGNYRGMVCSFITSLEYQNRFSTIPSHNNAECAR